MRILGITPLQQYIVKQVQLGDSYQQIAEHTGETVYEVVHQEMLAYSLLSKRWKLKEVDVRKKLSMMLLVLLALLSPFESQMNDDFNLERAYRVTARVKTRRREIDDLAIIDV